MGADSKIQWTHHTFNPWRGCTKVHAGCTNCYAESYGKRFGVEWGKGKKRVVASEPYWRQPLKWARDAAKAGERRRVFCASLADVLDEEAPRDAQERLWDLIRETFETASDEGERPDADGLTYGGLDWLLLTKRPERWEIIPEDVRPRVWLGTSIADQATADEFVPRLLSAQDFAVRFLSIEPQVGPISLDKGPGDFLRCPGCGYTKKDVAEQMDHHLCKGPGPGIDWVIVGGESGPKARPFDIGWARSIKDQCAAAGVPCFVKQFGAAPLQSQDAALVAAGIYPDDCGARGRRPEPMSLNDKKGGDWSEWPEDLRVREFPTGALAHA